MISPDTLRVTSGDSDQTLHLAPFGVEELAKFIPMNPDNMPYETTVMQEVFSEAPEDIFPSVSESAHVRIWGIYEGEPSLKTFVGTVGLAESEFERPEDRRYEGTSHEFGTAIFSPDTRGRGIGALAKLAVVRYAIETNDAHLFVAQTSEHNVIAHKSLTKIGFTHMDTYTRYTFPGGEQTISWVLGDRETQRVFRDTDFLAATEQQAIEDGWRRYEEATQRVTVEVV